MITDIYVKGRNDFGNGKYAVVIVQGEDIVHKVAYYVGRSFGYKGQTLDADQYNMEIVAICYALKWCKNNNVLAVNIFCNTKTCQKWYYHGEIPESRVIRDSFFEMSKGIDIFADYIPKNDTDNEFNVLVNKLAETIKPNNNG